MLDQLKNTLRNWLGVKAQTTTLREPATWLLDLFGSETAAGVRPSQKIAYSLAPYYCGVRLISETLASLPLNVYRRTPGDRPGRVVAESHPVHFLLHREPNPEMTSMVFRECLTAHCIDHGNAYAEIQRDSMGVPVALWPLAPTWTWPRLDSDGTLYYETWVNGEPNILQAKDVLHVPGLGWDGRKGYPLLQLAAERIGLDAAQRNYSGKFYANGGHVSAVVETENKLDDETFARLKLQLRENFSGLSNAHRVALLEYGLKFRSLNQTNVDAQLAEGMKFSIEDWARWFNIPPHKLKDLTHSTFANIEHQSIEWVTDSIRPWATRWEQEFNRKLFFQKNVFYVKHVVDGLLRGDQKSRYDAYAIARNWGWLSVNDIRELEDMNPLPDAIGNVYLSPLNMQRAQDVGKEPEPAPAPPETNEPEEPDQDDTTEREAEMVRQAARRAVMYETRRLDRHSAWEVYQDGELAAKIVGWCMVDGAVADKYNIVAEQLNLIAEDEGISEDELVDRKVEVLSSLALTGELPHERLAAAVI